MIRLVCRRLRFAAAAITPYYAAAIVTLLPAAHDAATPLPFSYAVTPRHRRHATDVFRHIAALICRVVARHAPLLRCRRLMRYADD